MARPIPPGFPKRVLDPAAGYGKGSFNGSFDPRMGRGYAAGDIVTVEPNETRTLVNHGLVDAFFRWKVSLNVVGNRDATYAPNTAYPMLVRVVGKNENDAIDRNTVVGLGRGQVLYVPGRSLQVLATNPTDQPLDIQYSLDEATPGLSSWTSDEPISLTAGTEYPLTIEAFATSIQVVSTSASPGWILRGYDQTGTLIYEETTPAPRSGLVPVAPSLYYTIEPASPGTWDALVVYQCVG